MAESAWTLLAVTAVSLAMAGTASAAVVAVDDGALTITGSAGEGQWTNVSRNGDLLVVSDDATYLRAGPGCLPGSPVAGSIAESSVYCGASGVARVVVVAGDGHDAIFTRGLDLPVEMDGGADDDILWSGLGDDVLRGGPGPDDLSPGEGGFDQIDGGEGTDGLGYTTFNRITVSDHARGLVGTEGDLDLVTGVEILGAGAGDDTLQAAGWKHVSGGYGNDEITGGEGPDNLGGSVGDDKLIGGGGDDALFGSSGADTIDAGAGNDLAVGGDMMGESHEPGLDVIEGGSGDDRLDVADDDIAESPRCGDGTDRVRVGGGDQPAPDCESAFVAALGAGGYDAVWGGGAAAAAPPVGPSPGAASVPAVPAGITRATARGTVSLVVTCPRQAAPQCNGVARLEVRALGRASASYVARAGRRARIRLVLGKRIRRALQRRGRLRARAVVTTLGANGRELRRMRSVTLR